MCAFRPLRFAPIATALAGAPQATPARAEAPPRPLAQREFLQPCKAVGAGWFYIPGTATCVRVAAYVKTDHRSRSSPTELIVEADRNQTGPLLTVYTARLAHDRPMERSLNELKAFVHTATETDLGMVGTTVALKSQLESPPRRPSDLTDEFNRTGARTLLEQANVTIAGFTAGYRPSFFDFPTASLSYTTAYASETNTNVVAYTGRVSRTIDATLSLEDGTARNVVDRAWGEYKDSRAPNVVAALDGRFDWGAVHVAAASRPVHAFAPTGFGEQGSATGFAATAAVEHWFDLPFGMAGDVLLSASSTRGGLDYLNASNYPADFAISRSGRVYLTEGYSFVASYLHKWTKEIRTIVTASKFQTRLDTDTFRLRTEGLLLQAALEYSPVRGFTTGLELNLFQDSARGFESSVSQSHAANQYLTGVLYARRKF